MAGFPHCTLNIGAACLFWADVKIGSPVVGVDYAYDIGGKRT